MAETNTASSEIGGVTAVRLALLIAGWLVVMWSAASILIAPISVTFVAFLVGGNGLGEHLLHFLRHYAKLGALADFELGMSVFIPFIGYAPDLADLL